MSDLKPCPFCGGSAEFHIHGQWYKIVCQTCWAETDEQPTYAEAVEAWNRRINPAT